MIDTLGYSKEEVEKLLRTNRTISFRYELLDKNERSLGNINCSGSINFDSSAKIMRVGNFNLKHASDINILDERIQPYFRLHTPRGTIEYPLGVYLISSPAKVAEGYKYNVINFDCYDKTIILKEDKFDARHFIEKGTRYIDAITSILYTAGIYKIDVEENESVLETDIEYVIGLPKVDAVNALLQSINYNNIWFDEIGNAKLTSYVPYQERLPTKTYFTEKESVIKIGCQQSTDIYNIPNVIIRYVESPEREYMVAKHVNNDPLSCLSTVTRGRKIVDIAPINDIADKNTLEAYVERLASENKAYEYIKFDTCLMPEHSLNECIEVKNKALDINSKYIETAWTMNLECGGNMQHTCKKVIEL